MYSYHGCIKKRIMAGELVKWEFVKDYPGIGECLVLYFSAPPFVRPIRPHRYPEYELILNALERGEYDKAMERIKTEDSHEKAVSKARMSRKLRESRDFSAARKISAN